MGGFWSFWTILVLFFFVVDEEYGRSSSKGSVSVEIRFSTLTMLQKKSPGSFRVPRPTTLAAPDASVACARLEKKEIHVSWRVRGMAILVN